MFELGSNLGTGQMATVVSNYLRSQKEHEHFGHKTDRRGVSIGMGFLKIKSVVS